MGENLRLARPFLVLLVLVTIGRWLLGVYELPYEKGNPIFSILNLTAFSTLYYGAFARRWLARKPLDAVLLGATLGAMSQLMILLATVLSYALGIDTYFNHPIALNAPETLGWSDALSVRAGDLLGNTIFAGLLGGLGWVLGGLLPEK